MRPKFQQMNDAVEGLRDAAERVLNNKDVFTAEDPGDNQVYERCCDATELGEDSRFPNVSTE